MNLQFKSIEENSALVSEPVLEFAKTFSEDIKPLVAEIDPQFTGSKEFCEHYNVDPSDGANCIIIEVVKGSEKSFACCLVPIGYRADLNSLVRKHFNARRVSFAPLEQVEKETKMEYGSITFFGLPNNWPILIDSKILEKENVIIGGGKKVSKLLIPTKIFKQIPNLEIIDGLSRPMETT
jgi:prolyl-tRNA editing enzyme YbaK/EbsC (Cys-tRNA(Pro) deacylase)